MTWISAKLFSMLLASVLDNISRVPYRNTNAHHDFEPHFLTLILYLENKLHGIYVCWILFGFCEYLCCMLLWIV